MEKQEFRQLTEQQQAEFLKQLVEERTKGYDGDLAFVASRFESDEDDSCVCFSWEEPSEIFDECDYAYYQKHLENLCDSLLFNVLAYVNTKNQAVLCVHYYLYFHN